MRIEIVGGEEHGVLDGLNVECVEWAESGAYSHLADIWEPGDPVYVKRRNQTPPSDDLNVITIYVGGKRKRRANFKPHLRRRLKAVRR